MSTEASIRKFLPSHYADVVKGFIPELEKILDKNVGEIESTIQSCIDQLFLNTASGRYLIQLGENNGFVMPENSGLDIRSYKMLIPVMVSAPKQVRVTIDELIEVFYGIDKTHALVQSSVNGPYSLRDGDFLNVKTDLGETSIAITNENVNNINNVSVSEIAAVFNNSQSVFKAIISTDINNNDILTIMTPTRGSGGFVQITGGTLQNVLQFPSIAPTTNTIGTTWIVSKESEFSDNIMFKWNGIGINPSVYEVDLYDFVTIRNVREDIDGSFEVIDVGFDYFVVRNALLSTTSHSFTQSDQEVVFTKNQKNLLFHQSEYALSTEYANNSILVTVPAVPPLARRFLQGSAHLHGSEYKVTDFTRSSVKIAVGDNQAKPEPPNSFVLASDYGRYDFVKNRYKAVSTNGIPNTPTYFLATDSQDFSQLPHTVPFLIGDKCLYANVGEDSIIIKTPFKHGLSYGLGVTIQDANSVNTIPASLLNGEHIISNIINDYTAEFKILDSFNNPIKFGGVHFGLFDVYRHSLNQSNGSDFYLQFANETDVVNSGLKVGMSFKLDVSSGTPNDPFWTHKLRYKKINVVAISGNKVHISTGYGVGVQGKILSSSNGYRSAHIGGVNCKYYFDKTSEINSSYLDSLKLCFVEYIKESNSSYNGSYLYDPTMVKTVVNVSSNQASLGQVINKGSNHNYIILDSVSDDFPEEGEIVIHYGSSKYEGPIKYSSLLKNDITSQIIIDPAYKFKFTHVLGSRILCIRDKRAYIPTNDGADLPFYITGTTAARDTLFKLLQLLKATGIFIEEDVLLPELRFSDVSINPFT